MDVDVSARTRAQWYDTYVRARARAVVRYVRTYDTRVANS